MKVILLKDVRGVGKVNETKEVKRGYALNFLIPNKLAVLSSGKMLKLVQINAQTLKKRQEKKLKDSKILIKKLEGYNLRIEAKVGEGGKLFGAVTPQVISDNLKRNNFKVEKEHILIEKPIKEVGEYEVKIKLNADLECNIKLRVVE